MSTQPIAASNASGALHLVTFHVGELCMAVDIGCIQEIIHDCQATYVAHAPGEVSGVINLRGEVATIFNLRQVLGLSTGSLTGGRTLIIRSHGESIGLIVDRVADIEIVGQQAILPPPPNLGRVDGRFFHGVYTREGGIVVILNLEEVLSIATADV